LPAAWTKISNTRKRRRMFHETANKKIKELSHGAVRTAEEQGKISFHRFTEEQQLLYKNAGDEAIYLKTFTPAGVRLVFKTNSTSLFLKVNVPFITTRSYFSVDVCLNGQMIGNINNYADMDVSADYTVGSYPIGDFEGRFDLGAGEKIVTIHLPWSVPLEIEELSIDDDSFVKAISVDKKMLIFGDSITQGYDALHPSKHYTVMLADYLMADGYNKAVGGEKFIPDLARTAEDFVPDYILVAYGTNDWFYGERESFRDNCRKFYETLSRKYPMAKIFALTPIWRTDYKDQHNCGNFSSVADFIEEVTAKLDNVYCLCGFDLVPHQENMYGDWGLHPNDDGFIQYANNLYNKISDII